MCYGDQKLDRHSHIDSWVGFLTRVKNLNIHNIFGSAMFRPNSSLLSVTFSQGFEDPEDVRLQIQDCVGTFLRGAKFPKSESEEDTFITVPLIFE